MLTYSVVIPVYNVAPYLRQCLDSVLAQDTTAEFEVILVDDGSTDESGAICDEYAARDPRFQVIHQRNMGLPGARNSGLSAAKGQYILFLDSDDYWKSELLSSLGASIEMGVDIAVFQQETFNSDGRIQKNELPFLTKQPISGKKYLKNILQKNQVPVVASWQHLFRRAFLEENHLKFNQKQWFREDVEFYYRFIPLAETVMTVDRVLYCYRQARAGSLTATVSPEKIMIDLQINAWVYDQYPCPVTSMQFCLSVLGLSRFPDSDAARDGVLFVKEHQYALSQATGLRERILRVAYRIFGFYHGARIMTKWIAKTHQFRKRLIAHMDAIH